MFQPRVKLEFVRRYTPPSEGWKVFVDIDASEEGRTGGERTTQEARARESRMRSDGRRVRAQLEKLSVTVGGSRSEWCREHKLPSTMGDRDIVAFHHARRIYVVAEVEGESSGQPEQKLYKAIGQLVLAASQRPQRGWRRRLVLVVHEDEMGRHLKRGTALKRLGISALQLHRQARRDLWLFGSRPIPSKTPS